ncbi:MAG TPA: isoprenylcysteine carboxylmethyltransferase family protein, partial [Spirochaetia bacterium]|nr:isoprenylcysteine carboxylmethyltransferase family protein [Spirochaetia bacterium]
MWLRNLGLLDSLLICVSFLWVVSEAVVNIRRHSGGSTQQLDRASHAILIATTTITIAAGVTVHILGRRSGVGAFRFAHSVLGYIGLILMLGGIAVRWTAIVTLGRQFTVDVSIVKDHKIVDHGIYGHVRHPTYAGLLLSFFGLAVAYENWISFLVIFPPILAAYLYRIMVEE